MVTDVDIMLPLESLITCSDETSVTEPVDVFSETDVVSFTEVDPSRPVLTSFWTVVVVFPSVVTVVDVSVLEPSSSMTSDSWCSGGFGSGLGVGGVTGTFLDQWA